MTPEDEEKIDERKTGHIDRPLGHRLRLERDASGMTQEALAEKLDVSAATIQKYEQGRTRVPASRLWQICNLLDIEVADVFKELPYRVAESAKGSVSDQSARFVRDDGRSKKASAIARAAAKLPTERLDIAVELIKALKPKRS